MLLTNDPVRNARGGLDSKQPIEAWVPFGSTANVGAMSDRQILMSMIVSIAAREVHETLEWSQLADDPGRPLVDPHLRTDDLEHVLDAIHRGLLTGARDPLVAMNADIG
jgi:hypothetical protein